MSSLPLIAWIETSKKPVKTVVQGKAYSCGAMLLLSGTPGHRFANRYSDILIHEVASDFGYGKSSQQFANAKYLERINALLSTIITEKTKMKKSDVDRYMTSNLDLFIDAETALKYGIIDKII